MGAGQPGEPFLMSSSLPPSGPGQGGGADGISILHVVFYEGTCVVWVDVFRSFRRRNTQCGLRSLRTLNCVCDLDRVPYLLAMAFLSVKGNTDHAGAL